MIANHKTLVTAFAMMETTMLIVSGIKAIAARLISTLKVYGGIPTLMIGNSLCGTPTALNASVLTN